MKEERARIAPLGHWVHKRKWHRINCHSWVCIETKDYVMNTMHGINLITDSKIDSSITTIQCGIDIPKYEGKCTKTKYKADNPLDLNKWIK